MSAGPLSGSTVFVTGAAGLLGRQHCSAVLEAGGKVIAIDVDDAGLRRLSTDLTANELLTVQLDITDFDAVNRGLSSHVQQANRICLVNNAAVNPKAEGSREAFSRLESLSVNQWNYEIAVGLTGSLIMTQILGAEMAARGEGSIVNVSSDHGIIAPDQGLYGGPDSARVKPVTYSVVKHGLIGLTRYTATYWAHRGVRVNALCPGGTLAGQDGEFLERFAARVPMGRMANPDEYRGALVFLLSDASSYMTGANLVVDGGRSVW